MPSAHNIHANLIAIDGKGVLITGSSGSGKTTLALHLFRRCAIGKIDTHWIADDQVILESASQRLLGRASPNIANKIEIRGFGIVDAPTAKLKETQITLCVALVSSDEMKRFFEGDTTSIAGVEIDSLVLGNCNMEAASNAVFAKLGIPPWL